MKPKQLNGPALATRAARPAKVSSSRSPGAPSKPGNKENSYPVSKSPEPADLKDIDKKKPISKRHINWMKSKLKDYYFRNKDLIDKGGVTEEGKITKNG